MPPSRSRSAPIHFKRERESMEVEDPDYYPSTDAVSVEKNESSSDDTGDTISSNSSVVSDYIPGSRNQRYGSFVYCRFAEGFFEPAWRLWMSVAFDLFIGYIHDHYNVARYGTEVQNSFTLYRLPGNDKWDLIF